MPRACAAFLLVGVACGCSEMPGSAVKELNDAEEDYRAKRYEAAVSRLDKIIRDFPAQKGCEEAYYLRALCRVEQSRKTAALSDALACIQHSRQAGLTARAQATAGAILSETGRSGEAIPHLAAALRGLPDAPPADLLRYQYAVCLQRQGCWGEAKAEFAAVSAKYPQSTVAEFARRARDWPHRFFSIQCGTFRDGAAAVKLKDTLGRAGLPARVEIRKLSGESLHTVYVGQYAGYEQAQGAVAGVRRMASGALVVP